MTLTNRMRKLKREKDVFAKKAKKTPEWYEKNHPLYFNEVIDCIFHLGEFTRCNGNSIKLDKQKEKCFKLIGL